MPRFYEPEYADGGCVAVNRTRADVPETIEPSVIADLDAIPLPTKPIVPYVECVHDRIAIEIMRGCPWQCRFCQSTVIKRPLRMREVETIVQAALESYRNTGHNEISLLSLSTSDYPYFEELMRRMHEVFEPLGVSMSIPSLRVNEQLQAVADLIEHRAALGADAGPRGGPRRHARADPQEDQERGSVRRLPRGVSQRLPPREAVFPVRPAGRAAGRSGRHRRHGRDDRADRPARFAGGSRR